MSGKIQFWNITPAPGSCPFARRTWIALEEKKLAYEINLVEKAAKPKVFNDLYHEIWTDPEATTKVPIIVDTDGTKVTESLITVEYLDAKYPDHGTRLLPSSPALAAQARLFAEMFSPYFLRLMMPLMSAKEEHEVETCKEKLIKGLTVLDSYLQKYGSKEGPFLLNDYSLAEVATAPFVQFTMVNLKEFKKLTLPDMAEEAKLPRLQAWIMVSNTWATKGWPAGHKAPVPVEP